MQRKQVFCKDAQYRSILWAFPDFDFGDTDEKDVFRNELPTISA